MYEHEQSKAIKTLVFWHGAFVITFIVFVLVVSISGMTLLREISAVSQCIHLDDNDYVACYELKKHDKMKE